MMGSMMSPVRLRRWAATAALAVIVVAGLAVHGLAPDTAATDIAGDALYAAAVYAAGVLLLPRRRVGVALAAAAWCVAVEVFQLTGLPLTWGAAFPPVLLVLGTVFDPRDLVVYVCAVAAAAAVDVLVTRRARPDGSGGLPRGTAQRSMGR